MRRGTGGSTVSGCLPTACVRTRAWKHCFLADRFTSMISHRLDPNSSERFVWFSMLVEAEGACCTREKPDRRPLNKEKGLVGIHVDYTSTMEP